MWLADSRWCGPHGIGRYATEILSRLHACYQFKTEVKPPHPLDPVLLGWAMRRHEFDGFYSPSYMAPLGVFKPTVLTLHDVIPLEREAESSLGGYYYFRHVLPAILAHAARIVTVSDYSRVRIADCYQIPMNRIVVIPNGVSPGFAPVGSILSNRRPYFLAVANAKKYKNISVVIQAMKDSGLSRHFDLLIIGNLSVEKHEWIRVISGISEKDLQTAYRGSTAVLVPSKLEGFGLPLLEGMASGVPVISSDAASLPEVGGDAPLYCSPDQVEEWVEALTRVASENSLRTEMIHKGLIQAKKFNWDRSAEMVNKLLKSI
jgi:glycosyltransferase involved in cell wall biosynthesis